jgi:hypothetical protein
LSARITKTVYHPNVDFLDAELGNHTSQIWRALVKEWEVLTHGLTHRIGDGTSTRIWTQNWLPPDQSMRPIAWLEADPTMLVSELVDSTSASWI